ncbi:MAG: succinate dehydrogenase cytochrome b subunit [Vicinamibacterales bacterium]
MSSRLLQALSSSIGTKLLIAFTGLCLFVFLIGHLAGNLLFLLGPDAFNHYSHNLVSNPLVYVAEAGLILVFLLHIVKTVTMWIGNQAARPNRYVKKQWAKTKSDRSRKSLASSTMIVTGTITLLFVVSHLATFKFGAYYDTTDGTMRDLYRLQLEIFSQPGYVAFYLVAMAIIFLHLWHGLSSAAQSFGVDHPQWTPRIIATGRVLAVLIGGGFFILPIYTFILARGV